MVSFVFGQFELKELKRRQEEDADRLRRDEEARLEEIQLQQQARHSPQDTSDRY